MDLFALLKNGTTSKKKVIEEPKLTQKEVRVTRKGDEIPAAIESFEYLDIELLNTLKPTAIQKNAIPILIEKRDLIAIAPTGSGKTLAYLIPIIKNHLKSLIIIPTRELEMQIKRELKKYTENAVVINLDNSKVEDINRMKIKPEKHLIYIATPMKILNALKKGLKIDVDFLVLDECDKLLELGFIEQLDEILHNLPNGIQKSLFSATIPSTIEEIAKTFMKDPCKITCGLVNSSSNIKQELIYVGQEEGKLIAIRDLLQKGLTPPILIFVQSIERAKDLFHELVYENISVDVIHSDRTKAARDAVVENFRLGKIFVLISTELMARGIDFKGVGCVINYDFPINVQSYVHRIGRTGRAGRTGLAYTLFTKDDAPYLKTVVNVMRDSGCDVPDWMLKLKGPTKEMKKELKHKVINRDTIKTTSKYDLKKLKKKQDMIRGSINRKKKDAEVSKKSKRKD